MTLPKAQIAEINNSANDTRNYDARLNIDTTLPYPITENGYCTGQLVALEYQEASGEVIHTRDGRSFTKEQDQLLFIFEVKAENTVAGTLDLKLWTNTTADGVKNDDGKFSKLTRLLISLGVIEAKSLNPRSRVQFDLNSLGGETFRFKVNQKGRFWEPDIDTIKHIDNASEPEPETKPGFDLKTENKAESKVTA